MGQNAAHHARRPPLRTLRTVRRFRLLRPDLRIDLVALPSQLSRPRCARPDGRAGDLRRRPGDRRLAGRTLHRAHARAVARLRGGRDLHRLVRFRVPPGLRRLHGMGLRHAAAGGVRSVGLVRDAMDHGCTADRSAGDRAGRHVPLDGRRRAATLSAAARARDQRALFPEQLWRGVRRARERVPVHSRARVAGHGDAGRRAQRRHRHRRLRHCAAVACSCHSGGDSRSPSRSRRAGARKVSQGRNRRSTSERRGGANFAARIALGGEVARRHVPRGRCADRPVVVRLRDRLDPHAGPRARRVDARVRAHARCFHPRSRGRRRVDPQPHRSHRRCALVPRARASPDGPRCDPDAAALRRAVRCFCVPDGGSCAHRSRLHAVPCRERRGRAGRDVAGNVPRRHDAAVDHASADRRGCRRACDRTRVRGEHVRRDPRRDRRSPWADSVCSA